MTDDQMCRELVKQIGSVVREYVAREVAGLEKRIAELEATRDRDSRAASAYRDRLRSS